MKSVKVILPENIKRIRKHWGLTQNDFAKLIGCSKNHLSAIERGVKFPRAKMIENICENLNIKPFILFIDFD